MTATTLDPTTTSTTVESARTSRRRRPRPRPPEAPAWACENCTQTNTGRRRRCADCGTSRV